MKKKSIERLKIYARAPLFAFRRQVYSQTMRPDFFISLIYSFMFFIGHLSIFKHLCELIRLVVWRVRGISIRARMLIFMRGSLLILHLKWPVHVYFFFNLFQLCIVSIVCCIVGFREGGLLRFLNRSEIWFWYKFGCVKICKQQTIRAKITF